MRRKDDLEMKRIRLAWAHFGAGKRERTADIWLRCEAMMLNDLVRAVFTDGMVNGMLSPTTYPTCHRQLIKSRQEALGVYD